MVRGTARFLLGLLGLFGAGPATAVRYDYEGSAFAEADPPYTGSNRIVGVFERAQPLPGNLPLGDIAASVLRFSFSDGVQVRDESNSRLCEFAVATDPLGRIVAWQVWLRQDNTGEDDHQHSLETRFGRGRTIDLAGLDVGRGRTDCAGVALLPSAQGGQAGNWSNNGIFVDGFEPGGQ